MLAYNPPSGAALMAHNHQGTPELPIEIWIRILGFVSDFRYLPRTWLNCRRVSHAFKAATEMAFTDVYLTQMTIRVEMAEVLELKFDGLSPDREFVRFRHLTADKPSIPSRIPSTLRARLERETERVWQREHDQYLISVQNSAPSLLYQVWLMGFVEDPGYPNLSVDTAKRTLSFRWKVMLSTMFGEIEYRKWLCRKARMEDGGDITTDRSEAEQLDAESVQRRNIEMCVRKTRPRNRGWNRFFESWRRQEWQLDALLAYRADIETKSDLEEDWGTFYDLVEPKYGYEFVLSTSKQQSE